MYLTDTCTPLKMSEHRLGAVIEWGRIDGLLAGGVVVESLNKKRGPKNEDLPPKKILLPKKIGL